jgi:hypothetical protein
MSLRFIGIDPDTNSGNSPTIWLDDTAHELVIQGWRAGPELLAECEAVGSMPGHSSTVPEHEAVVRIPARMVPALREACDATERAND